MPEMIFHHDAIARGRNGSFTPAKAEAIARDMDDLSILLTITSAKSWGQPPIDVRMNIVDARNLATILNVAVNEKKIQLLDTRPPAPSGGPETAPADRL